MSYPLAKDRVNAFNYPYGDQVQFVTCQKACQGSCPESFCPSAIPKVPLPIDNTPVDAKNNELNGIVYDTFRANYDRSIEDMRASAIQATYGRYDRPSVVFASNGANLVLARPKFSRLASNRDLKTTFARSNGQQFVAQSDVALYKLATVSRSRLKRPVHEELDK